MDTVEVRDAVPRPQGMDGSGSGSRFVSDLRAMAIRGLATMYVPEERLFVFRVRRSGNALVREGLSRRYTAIALIGLAGESDDVRRSVLAGAHVHRVCERLVQGVADVTDPGDLGLSVWAAVAVGFADRRGLWQRLIELRPGERECPVVEFSWVLDAAVADPDGPRDLAEQLANRLLASFNARAGVFPHVLGREHAGLRAHVSCFADFVYPIHALANYGKASGDRRALDAAARCAEQICRLQGARGQWWWQYDRRTGDVIEPYPVYAIHQDAMAPMALIALKNAGGPWFRQELSRGLDWLAHSPEIDASLIDPEVDLIWRKVARREPRKLSRYLQGAATRLSPWLRVPGLDHLFPPRAVDYEDRPYHLGWLLYAWPQERAVQWDRGARV